ncbi:CLUMA_CG017126, isoform A, partial [Clunio marinus]
MRIKLHFKETNQENIKKPKKKQIKKLFQLLIMENFNNFFQQQIWNSNKNLHQHAHQQLRSEISSTEKGGMSSGPSPSSILSPSKLVQSQPPHSTNLSIDNRLYLDGLRQQQQARHQQSSFSNGTLTISPALGGGSSRDNNNNGLNNQTVSFSSQKMLNRLDIDAIRNISGHRNVGSCSGASSLAHHQHGTILFNTLNGGALGAGSSSSSSSLMNQGSSTECFNGPDLVDSTTPPPTAISMPPASSASSSSSTVSTNIGLNRNSNGSQDANPEKIKTPNSIR